MSEEFFVAVNDDKVDLKLALNCFRGLDDSFLNGVVEMIAGRQFAAVSGIEVTDEELQRAVDEYRYLIRMESADAFNQYLKDRKISLPAFEAGMENELLRNKTVDAVPDDEVDAYFAENQLNMEKVELYHIRLEDEDTAQEVKSLLDEGEENFLALAFEHSKDVNTAKKGGYVGALGRKQMVAELEAAVFSAAEGDVVGPIKTENGYNLFKVGGFIKPDKTNSKLRMLVKAELYQKQVADQHANSKVECSLYEVER